MAQSCPNCKIPCTGCAGAKIMKASNGATVCTKCVGAYENALKAGKPPGNNQPLQGRIIYPKR